MKKKIKSSIIEELGDGTYTTRNIELERELIGTLFKYREMVPIVEALVGDKHFVDPRHKLIFQEVCKLHKEAKFSSPQIVQANVLRKLPDEIEPEDLKAAVTECGNSESVDCEAACRTLNDLYLARKIKSLSKEIDDRVSAGEDISELISHFDSQIKNISIDNSPTDDLRSLDDVVRDIGYDGILRPTITGIPTPFPGLNDYIRCFRNKNLYVVGGRPGCGKSVLLSQFAYHSASLNEITLFYAAEMEEVDMWIRMLCSQSSIRNSDLATLELSEDDYHKGKEWLENQASRYLFINQTTKLTPAKIRADGVKTLNKYGKIGLIVVDYLQKLKSGKKHYSRYDEISDIASQLKDICVELNVPMVVASSMNREVEKRVGKDLRPKLSDLKESGEIEADASVVIFPWRPSVVNKNTNGPPEDDELIVEKNRHGKTGSVKVNFVGEYYKFENLPQGRQ